MSSFTEAIEKPVSIIIEDIEKKNNIKFAGIERIESEDKILEKIYAKNTDKALFPVCSYYISDIQIDSELYSDTKKDKGTELVDSNNKPIIVNGIGLKIKEVPIQVTVDLYAHFVDYADAYSFLLDLLWIDYKTGVVVNHCIQNTNIKKMVYYKPDSDFNSPEPKTVANYTEGVYTARISLEVKTELLKVTGAKLISSIFLSVKK